MMPMFTGPERRRVARLTIPRLLRGSELEHHLFQVFNLSPLGARIMHLEPLHGGVVCYVNLPPALGALRLTGRVVWTRLRATERIFEGDRRSHYESGIEFTGLTAAQQIALAAALETLQAASTAPDRETSGDPPTARQKRTRES